MSIDSLNKEEKEMVKAYRHFPLRARRRLRKEIEKIIEEIEDAEDLRDIKKRKNEPTIPAEDVYRELGL